MKSSIYAFFSRASAFVRSLPSRARALWVRYRGLKRWQQIAIAAAVALALAGLIFLLGSGKKPEDQGAQGRTVTLSSVAELSGASAGGSVVGSVRSIAEAEILAQSGGTVTSVHAVIGRTVPAGFINAELENASQRAAVLQAEGAYDSAVAARSATSLPEAETGARNAYRTAYTTLDTVLTTQIDQFFGSPTPVGPRLLINEGPTGSGELSRARDELDDVMDSWAAHQSSAATADPAALLTEAQANANRVSAFLDRLTLAANDRDSRATPEQIAALASARASVNSVLSTLSTARTSYRTGSTSATAGADASVKTTLGGLRAAQAALEKTFVRAPIAGVVNFLPIRTGDYVTALSHAATVAQNGSLEIVAYVSEEDREQLSVGQKLAIEGGVEGVVTSIAPALDPTTKQIEIHLAVNGTSDLVNGQSVRVTLPGEPKAAVEASGPVLLPLAAVKLRADSRIVFSVGEDGRLVAHPVEIGQVRGGRIEITSALDQGLRIVTDARGLSEGQKVQVAGAAE